MGMFPGRPRNPVVGRPGDQFMGRSKDVCGKLFKNVFLKFSSQTH